MKWTKLDFCVVARNAKGEDAVQIRYNDGNGNKMHVFRALQVGSPDELLEGEGTERPFSVGVLQIAIEQAEVWGFERHLHFADEEKYRLLQFFQECQEIAKQDGLVRMFFTKSDQASCPQVAYYDPQPIRAFAEALIYGMDSAGDPLRSQVQEMKEEMEKQREVLRGIRQDISETVYNADQTEDIQERRKLFKELETRTTIKIKSIKHI